MSINYKDSDALQLLVSEEFGEWSNKITIDQKMINDYAELSGDDMWLHVDVERCKAESPFGGTIAHGFLTLSMLSHFAESFSFMIEGAYMGINYGFDSVRFISPVKVGKRIRAQAMTLEVVEKNPGQFMTKTEVFVEIEGEEKPALKAVWIGMQMVK